MANEGTHTGGASGQHFRGTRMRRLKYTTSDLRLRRAACFRARCLRHRPPTTSVSLPSGRGCFRGTNKKDRQLTGHLGGQQSATRPPGRPERDRVGTMGGWGDEREVATLQVWQADGGRKREKERRESVECQGRAAAGLPLGCPVGAAVLGKKGGWHPDASGARGVRVRGPMMPTGRRRRWCVAGGKKEEWRASAVKS